VPDTAKLVARHLVVEEFLRQLAASGVRGSLRLAVVGGDRDDPEILALQGAGIEFTLRTLGVAEAADEYLDLNERSEHEAHYDLVLCSQVLEHVWDHGTAFSNLAALVHPGGLLWMACPAPNREHASPEYYSAGFSPTYLRQNLEKVGFDVLDAGQMGSERLYFMTHTIGTWPSGVQYRKPLRHALFGLDRSKLEMLIRMVPVLLMERQFTSDPRWATESWALGRRRIDDPIGG